MPDMFGGDNMSDDYAPHTRKLGLKPSSQVGFPTGEPKPSKPALHSDHAVLADIVRSQVHAAQAMDDPNCKHFALDMLIGMAKRFADRTNADRNAFLQACDIALD